MRIEETLGVGDYAGWNSAHAEFSSGARLVVRRFGRRTYVEVEDEALLRQIVKLVAD